MENLKFRLKVRKFKCADCDTILLVEFKQPLEGLYSCPVCMEPMEYMDDLTVVQEMENGAIIKYRNRIKCLEDKTLELKEFVRDIAENWDCDDHNYNTPCRRCEAIKILEGFKNVQ